MTDMPLEHLVSLPEASAPLPDRASVAIVGGGIMGTSIAFHLAQAGVRDIVLLERDTLGSGSSGQAARRGAGDLLGVRQHPARPAQPRGLRALRPRVPHGHRAAPGGVPVPVPDPGRGGRCGRQRQSSKSDGGRHAPARPCAGRRPQPVPRPTRTRERLVLAPGRLRATGARRRGVPGGREITTGSSSASTPRSSASSRGRPRSTPSTRAAGRATRRTPWSSPQARGPGVSVRWWACTCRSSRFDGSSA